MAEHNITSGVTLPDSVKAMLSRQKKATRVNNEHYFRMHPELRTMVAAFTSALLRDKPDDVHLYAEKFFTNKDLARELGLSGWSRPATPEPEPEPEEEFYDDDELNPEMGGTTDFDPVELEAMLVDMFKEADQDGNGTLDMAEFAKLMATANLGLSKAELDMLLAEADENTDGNVSYAEFVPLAVEIVQVMMVKKRYEDFEEDVKEEYRDAAAMIISVSPEEVEAALVKAAAAVGQGGSMSKAQLKAMLKQPTFGLSKQQVNSAVAAITFGADGTVDSNALGPQLYDILLNTVATALQVQNLGHTGEMLENLFKGYDKEDTGFIDAKVFKDGLLRCFSFLSRVQVNALIADPAAPYNDQGQIGWREYMPKLATLIDAAGDPSAIAERAELSARAEFQPVELMNGQDKAAFEGKLKQLFVEADMDGNGSLDVHEFTRCLQQSDLGLTMGDIQYLLEEADADGDALISYEEFVALAYDALANLSREKAIMQALDAADGY